MRGRKIAASALAGALLLVAPSAVAHELFGEWGASDLGHDDDGLLCETCTVDDGNAVTAWQVVLDADDYGAGDFGDCQVDSFFGSETDDHTRKWQAVRTPNVVDGIVGSGTWGAAESPKHFHGQWGDYDPVDILHYHGAEESAYFGEDLEDGGADGRDTVWWDGENSNYPDTNGDGWTYYDTYHFKNNAHSDC